MTSTPHASKSSGGQQRVRPAAAKRRQSRKPLHPAGVPHETSQDPRLEFSDEEWHDMVAMAAYYRAESRGFEGGSPDEDWYEAEARLREQLGRAENEADQRAQSGLDLTAHKAEGETDRQE
jgi:hypothetical protein